MAVGRRRFAELGGFDEEFFLYGEEEHLARKLARQGQSVILDARASIAHAQHTSVSKTGGFAVEQYFRTRALVYRRNASSDDCGLWLGVIRSLPLVASLVFRPLTSPGRAKLHYRRSEDRAWCRAALRGLLHGLLRHPVSGDDPAAP